MEKPNCMYCGSVNVQNRGNLKAGNKEKRYYCKDCRKWFSSLGAPKILLLDIETSHILFEGWDIGDQYVRPDQIRKDWSVICWSAKWLFDGKMYHDALKSKEAISGDDKRCISGLHKLLSDCDIVITQNGDKFDLRKLNWKFIKYGLPPNNHYLSIDTLKKSRQVCDPTSHGLNFVGEALGFGGKSPVENNDWRMAEVGDTKSISKLSRYCDDDVWHLEDWYLILRPWMKTHPNLSPYLEMYQEIEKDEAHCPRCLQIINSAKFSKEWISLAGKHYKRCNCPHCGCVIRVSMTKQDRTLEYIDIHQVK